MKHHRIYLAGPMTGLTLHAATHGWRAEFQRILVKQSADHAGRYRDAPHMFDLYTPLRGHEYLDGDTVLNGEYKLDALTTQSGMFYRDRNDVRECDVMVACFLEEKGNSIGTCMEIGWADAFQRPLIMVAHPDSPHRTHPLLRHAACYIVDDLEDAARVCSSILLP